MKYLLRVFIYIAVFSSFSFFGLLKADAAQVAVTGQAESLITGAYLDFTNYESNVVIDLETGIFSGYGFSEDLGWIAFGTDDNPSGPVVVSLTTGEVSGKAKVLATGAYLDFTNYESNVVIDLETGIFSGYGFSEDIGWFDFWSPGVYVSPTVPSTPFTTTPTTNTTPTWTWEESEDIGSGIDYYIVQWCQNENFIDCGVNTGTTDTVNEGVVSYTHSTPLSDGTWYFRAGAVDNTGNASSPSGSGTVIIDNASPIIPSVTAEVSEDDNNSATIIWTTDEESSSMVEYGLTDSLGTETEEENTDPRVENHNVAIENLLPCTTYYFKAVSKDSLVNTGESEIGIFTTTGCAGNILSEVSEQVDSSGDIAINLISENDKGIELYIPQNFYGESLVFQIKELEREGGLGQVGKPYSDYTLIQNYIYDIKALLEVGEYVQEFDEPIEITIYFDEEEVSHILSTSTLAIYRWDGEEWIELDNCTLSLNGVNSSITCTTINFSIFGLFGEGEDVVPPVTPGTSTSSIKSFFPSVPSCTQATPNGIPNLFQIDTTDTKAILHFTPVQSPNDKYAIVYGHQPNIEMFGIMFNYIDTSGVITYTINELSPSSTYYFKVRGQNGCMPGEWSSTLKITTKTTNSPGHVVFYGR